MATPVIGPVIAPVVNLPFNVPMQPLPGIVMKLFAAAVNAAGIMDFQETGTGSASVSHAADVYAPDHEGVYRKFGENEVVWAGGRVVRNLFPDLLTCATTYYTNFAGRTLIAGAGPNGEDVIRHTATAAATSMNLRQRDTTVYGTYLIARVLVRPVGQNMTMKLTVGNGSVSQGGEGPGWLASVPLVADQWHDVTTWARNDTWAYRDVLFQDPTTEDDIVVDIVRDGFQLEDATGRADLSTPSEYIPAETVHVFNYQNGNSVLNSVVTESQGEPIDPPPALQYYPDCTNAQIHSNDLANAVWVPTNLTPLKNAVGITGKKDEATTLTATAANGVVIANAVTAASNTHAAKWYLKRKTGSGVVECTLDGGTTWTDITSQLSAAFSEVVVDQAALSNPQIGVRIVTSGDEVVVGNAELHLDKSSAKVNGTSPIFTAASAASVDRTVYTFDVGNLTETGCIYFDTDGSMLPSIDTSTLIHYIRFNSSKCGIERVSNSFLGFRDLSGRLNGGAVGDWGNLSSVGAAYAVNTGERGITDNVTGYWEESSTFAGFSPDYFEIGYQSVYPFTLSNLQIWSTSDYSSAKAKITELMA